MFRLLAISEVDAAFSIEMSLLEIRTVDYTH